jgi:hypothetical protein
MIDSLNYRVPLPETAPASSHAIFAWTWINATRNSEYYMNCVDAVINGPGNGTIISPELLVANIFGGPTIPEWGTGTDVVTPVLLAVRPTITVSATDTATNSSSDANQNTTTCDYETVQPGECTISTPDDSIIESGDIGNNTESIVTIPDNTTASEDYADNSTTAESVDANNDSNSTITVFNNTTVSEDYADNSTTTEFGYVSNNSDSTDANCATNDTTIDIGAVEDSSASTVPVPDNSTYITISDSTAGIIVNITVSTDSADVTSDSETITSVPSAPTDINDIPLCSRGQAYMCTSSVDYVYCSATRTVPLKCPSGSECQHDETSAAFRQQLAYRCAADK